MPTVLMVLYFIEFGVCFLIALLMMCFNNKLAKDFSNLGRILKVCGLLLKAFMKVVLLLHWIVVLLSVIFIAQVSTTCKLSIPDGGTEPTEDMHDAASITAIVLFLMALGMHIGGAVFKSVLYIDPFLSDPDNPKTKIYITIICKKCGP